MKEFVQNSFEELFTNRRYGFVFYLIGTIVLGATAALIEFRTGNYSLATFSMIALFLPLHLLTFAVKEFPGWLVNRIVASNTFLYKQLIEDVDRKLPQKDGQRESLIIELVILEAVTLLFSVLMALGIIVLIALLTAKPLLIAGVLVLVLLADLWVIRSIRKRLLNIAPESQLAPYRSIAHQALLYKKEA